MTWIDELEALDKAATPGPHHEADDDGEGDEPCSPTHIAAQTDAELIAALRNALPRLLAAARLAEALEQCDVVTLPVDGTGTTAAARMRMYIGLKQGQALAAALDAYRACPETK
jgi:hypothetical protein